MSTKKNSIDMLHGPLPGKIILFAIPLALSSILQQLFNSADSIVAGRFIGPTALAAVGGVAPVITLLIGLFVGLSIGSNVAIQAAINGFGTAATAGSAAALNYEYYTYFFVSAFSQAAVTFIGQNFAAGKLKRCDTVFKFCMGAAVVCATVLSAVFVGMGNMALEAFTTDTAALAFASARMWRVEILECMPASYEVTAGALRGMGWSVLPTVVVVVGSCVLRIVYVFTLFGAFGSFEALMDIYPVTWAVTGATMVGLYVFARRRAYAQVAARKGVKVA